MTPPPPEEEALLARLKGTSPEKLAKSVHDAEGLGDGQNNGATVHPVYRPRAMKCLAVTESELKQIGLSNILLTAFFGIGSALLAFALDIDKDLYMSDGTPQKVADLANLLSTICWIFAIVFYILSAVIWFWRRDIIKTIEQETEKAKA